MIPDEGPMSQLYIHLGDFDTDSNGNREMILKVEYMVYRPDRYNYSETAWKNMVYNKESADLGTGWYFSKT